MLRSSGGKYLVSPGSEAEGAVMIVDIDGSAQKF